MNYTEYNEMHARRAGEKGLFTVIGVYRGRYDPFKDYPAVKIYYAKTLDQAIKIGVEFNDSLLDEYFYTADIDDIINAPDFARSQGINIFDPRGEGVLTIDGGYEWFSTQEIKELYKSECFRYDMDLCSYG